MFSGGSDDDGDTDPDGAFIEGTFEFMSFGNNGAVLSKTVENGSLKLKIR